MSGTEWQVEMRTFFSELRLEIVVLLHRLNLFIPIKSIERDVSVSHLYIILIKKKQKMLKFLSSVHMQTHTHIHTRHIYAHTLSNVYRKQVAMNITHYSRLDLFSFFSLFFLFLPREWKKIMIV